MSTPQNDRIVTINIGDNVPVVKKLTQNKLGVTEELVAATSLPLLASDADLAAVRTRVNALHNALNALNIVKVTA
jgi:hypothetical protein